MAYNAGAFMRDYKPDYFNSIREIRKRESAVRDEKAREMMKNLKEQRIKENRSSYRSPVLVCRRMEHLPDPYIY